MASTIVTIPGGLWLPPPAAYSAAAPAYISMGAMTAGTRKSAWIFRVPKDGTLHSFETRQNANANTPDNGLRFSWQNVSSAFPDGTQDQYRDVTAGFGAGNWLAPPGALTHDGTGGGTLRTVTRNQLLAAVIEFVSFTAGDSVSMSAIDLPTAVASSAPGALTHYGAFYDGSSWAAQLNAAPIILRYNDGSYECPPWPWMPALTLNTRTFNSGSTPAQRGFRFQLPWGARIGGGWVRIDLDGNADIILYDSSDNVLGTTTLLAADRSATSGCNAYFTFDDAVDVLANTEYRLVVKPTTVTNLSIYDFTINSNSFLQAMPGGAEFYATSGTTGAWSPSDTTRPFMGLFIEGIAIPATGLTRLINGGLIP